MFRRAVPLLCILVAGCAGSGAKRDAVVAVAPASQRAALAHRLNAIFDDPKFSNAHWGVRVETMDGETLYDLNGGKSFVTASTLKIFTTAAALEKLGPDFMYETTVEAVGPIRDGVLEGDIVVVGSGDPSLGAWHPDGHCDSACLLPQWVEAVRAAGIREIRGRIVGDGRCFTEEFYCGGWDYEDLCYWYAAGSSGLAMEENCFRTQIRPGAKVGDPAIITWTPDTKYIEIVNNAKTVEAGGTSNADILWRQTEGNLIRYERTVALDKDVINERGSIWDGERYAAFLFKEALEREGIAVRGEAANIRALDAAAIDAAAPRVRVATHTSIPLSEQAAVVNIVSHNFFADMMVRTLGMKAKGEGSFSAGTKVVTEWLAEIGAPEADKARILDGSGLANQNFVQPRQMTAVLRHMDTSPAREAFRGSLAIAGETGWVKNRLTGPETKGRVIVKTGSIGGVRTFTGYAQTADGREVVFSILCNLYTTTSKEVDAAADAAVVELARYVLEGKP